LTATIIKGKHNRKVLVVILLLFLEKSNILNRTITGEGNDTPLELTLASRETDAKGIEFKVDGTAKCISLTMDCAESENPEDPTDPTDPEDPDREKTPLELAGWTNVDEGYDFTGWSIDENGNISGVNGAVYRIQNELITNQNDFTITANYQLEDEASVFFKVISLEFELDARHSSSEQVYVKGIANGDWLDAEGFAGTISITRVDGGEITLTVTGNGNETVLSGTREASKASSYLELGFYAGKGTISDLKVECKEGSTDPVDPEEPEESPLAEDGWTVEADGNADLVEGDFSGWEIIDDKLNSIKGKWMDMENIIIAKRLLTDVDNFSLQLILDTDFFSSPCIEILGIRLELDGNHGDGNQVFVKKDSVGAGGEDSWFACEDDIVYVNLSRKDGGKLQLTLWGEGNPTPIELAWDVAEETDVVKLIVFRGEASFLNISVGDPDKEHIKPDLSNVEPEEPEDPIDPEDPKDPTEPKETKKKGCNSSINQTTFLMFTIFSFVLIAFYVIRRKKATK
jgi:hypothetical protein